MKKPNPGEKLLAPPAPRPYAWKEYCTSCKRDHTVTNQPCPSCGVYTTPQPKSEKVKDQCMRAKICDGCEAYQDHY